MNVLRNGRSGLRIASVGCAFPEHRYEQATLTAALERALATRGLEARRLEQLHRNMRVEGRHLALPIEAYEGLDSFGASNDAFIRCGLELGARAVVDGLERADLDVDDVDHVFFVSVTGVATPSLDAGLMNRLGLRADVKRTPMFGLGCVAGAAGVARASDYLRAFPDHVAVLLSVELCSLTLQRDDPSIANLIACGLFGDGAAAAVLVGEERPVNGGTAPRVVATRSVFYPDTEGVMGWRVGGDGFRVVLSAEVAEVVEANIGADVDAFLADNGLARGDVSTWIAHPGGPRVLEALGKALALPEAALARTWRSLATIGNLSSASVLVILRDAMLEGRPAAGEWGLMLAMGPGFCSELVLLRG